MGIFDTLRGGKMPGWEAPGIGGSAVTVSDSVDDANGPFRALYVGVAGNIKVTMQDGTTPTFTNVPVGTHPFACVRIWSTGTTVTTPNTNIIGLK